MNRAQDHLHRRRYDQVMATDLEDQRGIDRGAIRERLALTPAERVQRLVDEVEIWSQIRRHAGVTTRAAV